MKKLLTESQRCAALLPLLMVLLPVWWLAGAARPAAAAATYTVTSTLDDGGGGTLRSAIALANADPGALIVFAPGVAGTIALQSELDLSASLTIRGPGADVVQIDGGGACRLFSVTAPDAQVTLSGLTLQNGSAFNDPDGFTSGAGGAVYSGGTLTLTGCVFTGSVASYGGAVYGGGALALSGCTFTGNNADEGAGGAVYSGGALGASGCTFRGNAAFYAGGLYSGGGASLTACVFSGNLAIFSESGNSGSGAGLYNDGEMTLSACIISGNTAYNGSLDNGGAGGMGGGLYSNGMLTLNHCSCVGNAASVGGGIYNAGTSALTQCTVSSNDVGPSADGENGTGGGLYNDGTLTLGICVVSGNTAYGSGAGLYSDAVLTMTGCTVTGNIAGFNDDGSSVGGGLKNLGTATLTDDIFYGDTATSDAEIANDTTDSPGATVHAAACDIQGSRSDGTGGFGSGILDTDPLFVRPVHAGGPSDPGDLHLQDDSPCILAGASDPANATDFGGNPRPNPPSIGAYDYATSAPVAYGQSVTTAAGQPVAVTLTGADPNFLPLSFRAVSVPTSGTISGNAPNLLYTPNPDFSGSDAFTFVASDGTQDSPPATVRITVTPAPALSALAFPTSVPGGTVLTATVLLTAVTPTDIVVGLSSSDPTIVRLFRAIVIPAGSRSATFAINTFRSHQTKTVTLRATLGKVTRTQDLTITGR